MYMTRRASLYRIPPEGTVTVTPAPEGPGSGYLVLQDDEGEVGKLGRWFRMCLDKRLRNLFIPQNRLLTVEHREHLGITWVISNDEVFFIPVAGQSLPNRRYYVVIAKGKYKGKIATCWTEEDMQICHLSGHLKDLNPTTFDQTNDHQQIEIDTRCTGGHFHAKSVVLDRHPMTFLRRKGWKVYTSQSIVCNLTDALGINESLRESMPNVDNTTPNPFVVGRWYCPYMFVKDDKLEDKDQLMTTMFYEMTLVQMWEEIYSCENESGNGNVVNVNVKVKTQRPPLLHGDYILEEEGSVVDGMVWYKAMESKGEVLGLSEMIVERMRWEEEKWGWVGGEGVVERMEEYCDGGKSINGGDWKKFTCYVLVERFVLKRMDGSYVVISFDFVHTNKVRCKWV